jgi:hypothetical protein
VIVIFVTFVCVTVRDLLRRITVESHHLVLGAPELTGRIRVMYGTKIHISGRFAGQLSDSSRH